MRINKIMTIIKCIARITKITKKHRISCENYENHENHRIPCEKYDNYENRNTPIENNEKK